MSAVEFYDVDGEGDTEFDKDEPEAKENALSSGNTELQRELIDDDAIDAIEYGIKITLGRCVTRERPAKDDDERAALESIGGDSERWVEGVEIVDVQPTPEDLAVVRAWLEKWGAVT